MDRLYHNPSIILSVQRSINFRLMTVGFFMLMLALFGNVTLREFAGILMIKLMIITYSFIFIAAPILVVWENREWHNWFKPNKTIPA